MDKIKATCTPGRQCLNCPYDDCIRSVRSITHEEVAPYVPTILISRSPTGGGTVYDDVNLLTKEDWEKSND